MRTNGAIWVALFVAARAVAQVVPVGETIGGRTYSEWSAEWWKWVYSVPAARNPLLDRDGSNATNGQPSGPVFFLAGIAEASATIDRTFEVPEGKYLFFPLRNFGSDNVDTDPPLSIEELRDGGAGLLALTTEMQASVDGKSVTNLFAYRARSPVFSIHLGPGQDLYTYFYGHPIDGWIDPVVSDGYWLMLEPLPVGTHTVRFGSTLGPPLNFSIDISSTIDVVPVPLAQRMPDLVSLVRGSALTEEGKRSLVARLEEARAAFADGRWVEGAKALRWVAERSERTEMRIGPSVVRSLERAWQSATAGNEGEGPRSRASTP